MLLPELLVRHFYSNKNNIKFSPCLCVIEEKHHGIFFFFFTEYCGFMAFWIFFNSHGLISYHSKGLCSILHLLCFGVPLCCSEVFWLQLSGVIHSPCQYNTRGEVHIFLIWESFNYLGFYSLFGFGTFASWTYPRSTSSKIQPPTPGLLEFTAVVTKMTIFLITWSAVFPFFFCVGFVNWCNWTCDEQFQKRNYNVTSLFLFKPTSFWTTSQQLLNVSLIYKSQSHTT